MPHAERRRTPAFTAPASSLRIGVALVAAAAVVAILQGVAVAGSFVFSDGFESGNLSSWTGSSQMVVQQQLVEAGSWAARATTTGQPAYAYETLSGTYSDLYYRIFFDVVSRSTTVVLVRLRTASSSVLLAVGVNKSSKLYTNNVITGKTFVGSSVTKSVWHELQVHVRVNGSSSREDVWLDGTAVSALSRSDPLGTAAVGRVDLGDTTSKRTFDVAFDEVATGTSFIDTTPPTQPAALSVSGFSDQEVDLSWSPSTDNVGVGGYTIYRSDDGGSTYNPIGTSSSTTYADKTVSPSTTYSYTVDAFDAAGNHSERSSPVATTTLSGPDGEKPTVPTGLTTTNVSAYDVDLAWDASSDNVGVTGYRVYRSDDGGTTFNPIGTASGTSYADKTVSPSAAYSYTVDAFDAAGNHSDRSSALTVTTPDVSTTPIQHVVIIDEENHTFNDVLGKFCVEQSSQQITRAGVNDPCVGTDQGVIFGSTNPYPLTSEPDVGLSVGHSPTAQQAAIDSGKMDGFSTINGCTASSSPKYGCLTQYDPLAGPCNGSCIPNMSAYATNYAISDATFTSDQTPSWAGHMVLGSASIERFVGNNPQHYSGIGTGPGWGCDSGDTGPWKKPDGSIVQAPSCVPSDPLTGDLGSLWSTWTGQRAYYEPTIFDRLDDTSLPWKIYGGTGPNATGETYGWTICPTFEECLGGPQKANLVSAVDKSTGNFAGGSLANDIAAGTLPALSFVTPTVALSGHQPQAMSAADNWVGTVVNAIQANPGLWSSTAIFVTFDDCGCFYDPVNPLQYSPEWGPRVPMLIISPFAKAGYTDPTPATFASLLAYVEQTFSLRPLNPCATVDSWDPNCTDDVLGPSNVNGGVTYGFQDSFDYGQTPLGAVTAVHTPLTAAQRTFVRNHPEAGDQAT